MGNFLCGLCALCGEFYGLRYSNETVRSRNPRAFTTEFTEITETERPWAIFSVASVPSVVNFIVCATAVRRFALGQASATIMLVRALETTWPPVTNRTW